MGIERIYKNMITRLAGKDRPLALYWAKRGNYKKLRSFLWTNLQCFDQGGMILDPLYRTYPGVAGFPKEFEIEITTRCHLRCIMCEHTYWQDPTYRNRDMTFAQFKHVCDEFPDLRYVNATGEGTGFLNKDFKPMIELLTERGVFILLVDSFDRFGPDMSRWLVELGVERLEISLDAGTKDTYEIVRKGAKWDRVLENIRHLKYWKEKYNSPFPSVLYRYVITTLNLEECIDFLELVNELSVDCGTGLRRVEFCGLLSFPAVQQYEVDDIPMGLIDKIHQRAAELNISIGWPHTTYVMEDVSNCTKWMQPYVTIDGDVILDCALLMSDDRGNLHRTRLGNVFEEPMSDIWDRSRYRRIRRAVNDRNGPIPAFCNECRGYKDHYNRAQKFGVIE
ncbi:MAG: radical SAM protein [Desulfobaccales bacterium]